MQVTFNNSNGALRIIMSGDIDDSIMLKTRTYIDNLLNSEKYFEVIFDFSDVPFMDSTGIGMLLGRYKILQRLNVPMFIEGATGQVDKVFFTSGIYEIIKKLA